MDTGIGSTPKALRRIDRNIPQYIHDVTDDEMSHQNFLNAYLGVRRAPNPWIWNRFRTSAGQHRNGIERKAAPYKPDAADDRHQLVDALSEQRE